MELIKVSKIKRGDQFCNDDGGVVWTAISDARLVIVDDQQAIAIDVEWFVDGGRDTRYWFNDRNLYVRPAREVK